MMLGPDKGKQGKVLRVIRPKNRLIVEGVNVVRFRAPVPIFLAVVFVSASKFVFQACWQIFFACCRFRRLP